jgi:dihydrofolate reductase
MGSRTFDTIGKPLPQRKNVILTRNKSRKSEWENLVYTDRPPAAILSDLEAEGFTQVVLAGGSLINSLFAQAKLIDEVIITVSPFIFGYGLSLFSEEIAMDLELREVERLGQNLVYLRYKVRK